MLENQFIRFAAQGQMSIIKNTYVLPTSQLNYQPSDASRIYIFISGGMIRLSLADSSDNVLYSIQFEAAVGQYRRINLSYILYNANESSTLAKGQRYHLVTENQIGNIYKSNEFIFEDVIDFNNIRYYCNEDAFGFPFKSAITTTSTGEEASMFLPIRLHSPQYVQEDKTYMKANGEVVTLYAKYYREWEGETEYLSKDVHDKIVAALSCDRVYIGDMRVTKSDNYQVDWENYDLDCDGVTKLARATFKVRENTNQRNSNY